MSELGALDLDAPIEDTCRHFLNQAWALQRAGSPGTSPGSVGLAVACAANLTFARFDEEDAARIAAGFIG